MNRREFISYSALGTLTLSSMGYLRHAFANQLMAMGAPDITALPLSGQPLQALPPIVNMSNEVGRFRSVLTPSAHSVPLSNELTADLWLYNGKVAPLIEVQEGDELDINLLNRLEQDTTVHWHGILVPPAQDGAPWHAVAPGASRQYRYTLPEGSAGLHWFHPHPHQGTAKQVAHGLAGALLVRPARDELPTEVEEHLLLVSDIRLDGDGQISPHADLDWMNGREGDLLLVNGQREPQLDVAPGSTLRLRLINACAGRYLRLKLSEHEMSLIGTDGGLIDRPQLLEELLLTPGERADLLVRVSEQSEGRFLLASHPYDRGWMGNRPPHSDQVLPLLSIHTLDTQVKSAVVLPEKIGRVEALREPDVHRLVELTEVMPGHVDPVNGSDDVHGSNQADGAHGGGMMAGTAMVDMHADDGEIKPASQSEGDVDHTSRQENPMEHSASTGEAARPEVDFLINGRSFKMGEVLFEGHAGAVEEWEVFNNSHMNHPFHVHGTHFQVVACRERDGEWQDVPWLAWKDTVNLAPYQRLKLRMVFRTSGDWLFHCHIIEHEELGMMATIRVS